MVRDYTIAIIGGGASGVGLAAKMVESLPTGLSTAKVSIALFDVRGFGGGAAYSSDAQSNLMNTLCGAIDRGFGGEFGILKWAAENPDKWKPLLASSEFDASIYLPRPVVGLYLSDLAAHARQCAAERQLRLDLLDEEVIDISAPGLSNENYGLRTRSGGCFEARYIYLALGHLEPAKTEEFQRHEHYYHSPYPITRLTEEIPKESSVGVIGTRLSAIDVCLGLVAGGHTGKLFCVSRRGRLPAVRADHGRYQFRKLEREELDKRLFGAKRKLRLVDVVEMLGSEIENAEGHRLEIGDVVNEPVSPVDYYEREIALAKDKARPWQAVLYATNRNIDLLWHHLEEEDKRILMSEWLNDWLTYRASIPRENAERLLALMRSGQLTVAGGARKFEYDAASEAFRITLAEEPCICVEHLVSAIGSTSRLEDADSALMRNLLAKGLVVPHRYGGVDCEFETGKVIAREGAEEGDSRMFALGPITSGVYFFTTALEIIERQATQRVWDLAFMLGDEWLERPEAEAWVDAQQGEQGRRGERATVPHDDGADLLERVVQSDQMELIDFKQLALLNDQIRSEDFETTDTVDETG